MLTTEVAVVKSHDGISLKIVSSVNIDSVSVNLDVLTNDQLAVSYLTVERVIRTQNAI